jgi:hypothetical protein
MHKTMPRCFLNKGPCTNKLFDAGYELVMKQQSRACYATDTGKYCEEGNIDVAAELTPVTTTRGQVSLVQEHQCMAKCSPAGPPCPLDDPNECFCAGAVGLDPAADEDQHALCLDRADCELVCNALEDCVSFDMHRSLPRCYLNRVTDNDCVEVEHDSYLKVNKVAPPRCVPKITRDPSPADDVYDHLLSDFEGETIFQTTGDADVFINTDLEHHDRYVSWHGCDWRVAVTDADAEQTLKFISVAATSVDPYDNAACAAPAAVDLDTLDTALYFASCPARPHMRMERVCLGETRCPVLTRCVVTEAQMEAELAQNAERQCDAIARQVATGSRAEYVVDTKTYGTHFQNHLVYRTPPHSPKMVVLDVTDTPQLTITMLPNNLVDVPAAHDKFVGDRVLLHTECMDSGTVDLAFLLPDDADRPRVRAAVRDAAGARWNFLEDFALGDRDFVVTVTAFGQSPYEVVLLVDTDECAQNPCHEHATCTNMPGSFECACKEGYTDVHGDGTECMPEMFECPSISVKVSNGNALDFGWRVREMRLYVDEHCSTEVVQPGAAVLYTATSNKGCTGAEISVSNHAREIIRSNQCYVKCGTGATFAQRRLSIKRRMSISGADWSNCDGYDAAVDSTAASNALCLSQPSCEQACNQLAECSAYTVAAGRCFLYSTCQAKTSSGTTMYTKGSSIRISSSPAFEGHPNSLVYDDYGMDDVTDDSHLFTEWWSKCFSCDAEESWLQVSVTLPDVQAGETCGVQGLKLWQDPNNAAETLHVQAGRADSLSLPAPKGVRADVNRESNDMGEGFYETWRFPAEHGACYPLTCGEKDTFYEAQLLATVPEAITSTCMCKQLCLDNIDRGCTAWRLYVETDSNWDDTTEEHTHAVCYLLTGGYTVHSHATPGFTSGTIDVVARSFTPGEIGASEPFNLVINGVGLPEGSAGLKQRVKLVDKANPLGCEAAPPETVSGLGCSDPSICAPKPSSHDAASATWSNVRIASAKEDTQYLVCYCFGPCYAPWQYVQVPGGAISVTSQHFYWSVEEDKIERDVGSFNLTVQRKSFAGISHPETWRVKLVDRNLGCDADESDALSNTRSYASLNHSLDEAFEDDAETERAVYTLTAVDSRLTAGKYLVCFCEVDEADHQDETSPCSAPSYPIASVDSLFLHIQLTEGDFAPPEGVFRNQRFSALNSTGVTIKVEGVGMTADHWDDLVIVDGPCDTGGVDSTTAPTETSATLITYSVTAPDAANVYSACIDGNKIGELTVTERAYVGWTYIFDPNQDGSVEITGERLDWQSDRIMLVDCASTCGLASPSQDVFVGGKQQTLGVVNAMVAKNEQMDAKVEAEADMPAATRTYTTVTDKYCRAGNLNVDSLPEDDQQHQCYAKCAQCNALGDCPEECDGYSPEHDGMNSQALCLAEPECRRICSELGDVCFGIDMYKYSGRCYLNLAGDAANGCKAQYENNALGSTSAYDFLAKGDVVEEVKAVTMASGVSTSNILRFGPIGFNADAGKYKVCFCDSALLPAGREACLAEKDYSLEVGELYVSGVSCLLADARFRRGTCYEMYHGGLACSDDVVYPAIDGELPSTAGLPTSWASVAL